MKSMRSRAAAVEVASMYADFLGAFVLDEEDRRQSSDVEKLGIRPVVTNTIMRGIKERKVLAKTIVGELKIDS